MSSMLEQAIIDAEALKEAAFKSAETQVLEKYSGEIKEAVTALLEQEDDELALEQPQVALPTDETLENIPLKATEGEELCSCPEDEEVIDLPLDKLVMEVENLRKEQDELFLENASSEDSQLDEEIVLDESTLKEIVQELVEEVAVEEEATNEEQEVSEEIVADKDINEKLDVDVDYRDNTVGWAGSSKQVQEEAVEELLASEQSTEAKEKRADINAAMKKIEGVNEQLNKKVEKTLSENKKLREAVKTLKEHIEDFSV